MSGDEMGVSGAYLCGGSEDVSPFARGDAPGSGGGEEFWLLPTGRGVPRPAGEGWRGAPGWPAAVPLAAHPGASDRSSRRSRKQPPRMRLCVRSLWYVLEYIYIYICLRENYRNQVRWKDISEEMVQHTFGF